MGEPTARSRRRPSGGGGDDPYAAPVRYGGSDPARPGSLRRARQNSLWVYLVGLPFLLLALVSITQGDPSGPTLLLRVGLVVTIGSAYVLAAWVTDASLRVRWGYVAGFVALICLTALTWGWAFAYYGVYVAIMVAMLIPWRQALFVILGEGVALLAAALLSGEPGLPYIALVAVVTGIAMGSGINSGRVSERLAKAEQRVSALAVVAERERISRDLHDILGHSLTAISIKSELARRLVEDDPARATAQIAEVEEIARQALADVRATASAIREVRAATELAGARSVLEAAGIEAHLPSAVPVLRPEVSELFGFVIREAVTNVVRHSEARTCTVTLTEDRVSVADDGRGAGDRSGGSGLTGLANRVQAAGGRLEVSAEPGRGTIVTATLLADARLEPAGDEPSAARS